MHYKEAPSYPQAELNQLVLMIEQQIGLGFSQRDRAVLHRFLQWELARQQMTLGQYVQLLSQGDAQAKAAWESLAEVMTTKETYFFRDMGQLLGIQEVVIPELLNMAQPFASITIMSVGCATGEELYSLGIIMSEHQLGKCFQVNAIGTDVSRSAIEVARSGLYGKHSFRSTTTELNVLREKYFVPVVKNGKEMYQIRPNLFNRIEFYQHNMVTDAFYMVWPGTVHLIVCRNVFIYFNEKSIVQVLKKFSELLMPGGFLVVGHTELDRYHKEDFVTIVHKDTAIYQKRHPTREERLFHYPVWPSNSHPLH